jgi:hypothetical protein
MAITNTSQRISLYIILIKMNPLDLDPTTKFLMRPFSRNLPSNLTPDAAQGFARPPQQIQYKNCTDPCLARAVAKCSTFELTH